jgi:hypothetical protein
LNSNQDAWPALQQIAARNNKFAHIPSQFHTTTTKTTKPTAHTSPQATSSQQYKPNKGPTTSTSHTTMYPYCLSSAVELPSSSWRPEKIEIFAGEGQLPINIMASFCYDTENNPGLASPALSRAKTRSPEQLIILPPELYPPTWSERKVLEKEIIRAAAEGW